MKSIFIAFFLVFGMAGMTTVQADIVLDWNSYALEAIKATNTAPTIAARNLAISQVAIYNSVNSIYQHYNSYGSSDTFKLSGYTGASAKAAVATAGYYSLSALFPSQLVTLQNHYSASLAGIANGPAKTLGIQLGQQIAGSMLTLRANDGWNAPNTYSPTPGAGHWQPTPPSHAPFLTSEWAYVTPFTMTSGDQFRQHPPPALDSPAYAAALNEVKSLGALNSTTRTADQTEIAAFWSDASYTFTPPGHWNTIAQTVAGSKNNTLEENARLFALLDLGLADAGISCWDMKRYYDFWRPLTAIQNADQDGNPATTADPNWEPLWPNPSFPSYSSGHSTFSGAAAALLAEFFGTDDIAFDSTSDGLPGVTRHFDSFSEAADEAGRSRIYGGIHFEFDNEYGLKGGDEIGRYVFANFLSPVPLPGTLGMALIGFLGMAVWRRLS